MARRIYASLAQDPVTSRAIEVAIGGLKFHRSIAQSDPFGDIDVEDLYELLRTLGDRHNNLIAPFVGSWSHAISSAESAQIEQAASRVANGLERDLHRAVDGTLNGRFGTRPRTPDFSVREFGGELVDALKISAGHNVDSFAHAAQGVLKALSHLSWIADAKKVDYLVPLVASAAKEKLWIATLNYDNTIEQAARTLSIDVDLGIRTDSLAVGFSEDAKICLAKLHGSVNWMFDYKRSQWHIGEGPYSAPELIFGSGNKLRIAGPYLDLLFAFRTRLEQSDSLCACGYSFRDPHINYLIMNWLNKDSERKLTVIDPEVSLSQIEQSMGQSIAPHGVILKPGALLNKVEIKALNASAWIASTYT
jgi:hypothetical protein